MTTWKNCRADLYYADEGAQLNDPGYEVRILDAEMVISYEGETGWVTCTCCPRCASLKCRI